MDKQVNLSKAKAHLSEIADEVKNGAVFMVCERNVPFAEFRPIESAPRAPGERPIGLLGVWLSVLNDINATDPEAIAGFSDGPVFPA